MGNIEYYELPSKGKLSGSVIGHCWDAIERRLRVLIYFHFPSKRLYVFRVLVKVLRNKMGFSALYKGQEGEHLCCGAFL